MPQALVSAPSGGWNTTTSPRSGSLKLLRQPVTSTRWPTSSVGLHRLARDAEGLDQEGLDPERKPERHRHDHDQLDQRAGGALLLCSGHSAGAEPTAHLVGAPLVRLVGGRLAVGVGGRCFAVRGATLRSGAALSCSATLGRSATLGGIAVAGGLLGNRGVGELLLAGSYGIVRGGIARLDVARRSCGGAGPAALAHARARGRPGRAGSRASRGAPRRGPPPRSARSWASAAGTSAPRPRRRTACAR